MLTLILDAGHSIFKGKTPAAEASLPHAIVRLTDSQWSEISARYPAGMPIEYAKVNGIPYAFGETAERHGMAAPRSGAARYTKDYYGVITAYMLARLYSTGGDARVFGSHPPGDVRYRDRLIASTLGQWHVEIQGGERNFTVRSANAFDEPLGGLMRITLNETGTDYANPQIKDDNSLVIDIGGGSTDFMGARKGVPDYSLAISERVGINGVVSDLTRSLVNNHADFFGGAQPLPERVRDAIKTGVYRGGGQEIDCENLVREACTVLLNAIANAYQSRAGGSASWDSIILTGGGSALLYSRLVGEVLNHDVVILAEDSDSAHMANVRGGLRLRRLYDGMGI